MTEGNSRKTLENPAFQDLLFGLIVVLVFLLIAGTMVQARVIPTHSMEGTLLVGDHLLVSRIGYDAGIPFTHYHVRLWREPRRSQMIIFQAPIPGPDQDFIERVIGMPGDTVQIRGGVVYVNGSALAEPYRNVYEKPTDNYGPLTVPASHYFVLGDNRNFSFDSRKWGFLPESNILGAPFLIYMSIEAPDDAWQPGEAGQRVEAYLHALLHPRLVRWHRLFTFL